MNALREPLALSLLLLVFVACAEQKFRASADKKPNEGAPATTASAIGKELFAGAMREPYKVDIIYLLDGSPSMSDNVDKVINNIKSLTENFLDQKAGFDYQIFILGNKVNLNVENERIERVDVYVGSHSALTNAQQFLSGQVKAQRLQLRPDSVKELLVVSDDNADQTSAQFIKYLDDNKNVAEHVRVNSIVAHSKCGGYKYIFVTLHQAKIGTTYIELGTNPRTAGAMGDLCASDWAPIFQSIGESIVQFKVQPKVRLVLKGKPPAADKLRVKINGSVVAAANYNYDAARNEIILNIESTEQDRIEVTY